MFPLWKWGKESVSATAAGQTHHHPCSYLALTP